MFPLFAPGAWQAFKYWLEQRHSPPTGCVANYLSLTPSIIILKLEGTVLPI